METATATLETQTMLADEAMRVLYGNDSEESEDDSKSTPVIESVDITKPVSKSKKSNEAERTQKKVSFRKSKKDIIAKKLAQTPSAKASMKVVKQPKAPKGPTKLGRRKGRSKK